MEEEIVDEENTNKNKENEENVYQLLKEKEEDSNNIEDSKKNHIEGIETKKKNKMTKSK